jgi:HKD family nuclease
LKGKILAAFGWKQSSNFQRHLKRRYQGSLKNLITTANLKDATMQNIKCITKNWYELFESEVRQSEHLRIITPFITSSIARPIAEHFSDKKVKIITRFNLNDFYVGASDLTALNWLMKKGAEIRGVSGLHTKMYLFDGRQVIVSSANMTRGGLFNNHEFGIAIAVKEVVEECRLYFENLWEKVPNSLTSELIQAWSLKIDEVRASRKGKEEDKLKLQDMGAVLDEKLANQSPQAIADFESRASANPTNQITRYFLKFLGTQDNRVTNNFEIAEEIKRSGCDSECAWPKGKRPRSINSNDVIFIARMLKPRGYAIFGRAIAIKHVEGRDDATEEDIKVRPWRKIWPHYIRVFHPAFAEGQMRGCPTLDSLIDRFRERTFRSTYENSLAKRGNLDPFRAIRQKAAIELTTEAAVWLDQQLTDAILRTRQIGTNSRDGNDAKSGTKEEVKQILIDHARQKRTIQYGDLCKRIKSRSLRPRSAKLWQILEEISIEENEAGRGLLSALVVSKGANKPGGGFEKMSKSRGRDTSDPHFHEKELEKVYNVWSQKADSAAGGAAAGVRKNGPD